jgi:hypothetical protein
VLLSLWLTIPALQPAKQMVTGQLGATKSCLIVCAEVIQVADRRLGCNVDLLGVPYACRAKLLQPGQAVATYVALPSAARLLSLADTDGTLLRLERDGAVIYSRSIAQQAWSALYGGWIFHAIYWPIAGLIIWKWPSSRFSRRVQWKDASDA